MSNTTVIPQITSEKISVGKTIKQTLAMTQRSLIRMKRTPEQFFDVLIQPIIFTVMFTYLFGGAIAGDVKNYLPTIIPGILVQSVISASVVTGVQLREDMDKGIFNRFRSLPIARISPLAGALLADTIRYTIATLLTLCTGYVMGYRTADVFHTVIGIVLVIVVAWCLSWIFALAGLTARSASAVQGTSMMIIMPLTFLSNAYVNPQTMPDLLRKFVQFNPLTHLISAVRQLWNDGAFGNEVLYAFGGAALVAIIFIPLCLKAYMKRA